MATLAFTYFLSSFRTIWRPMLGILWKRERRKNSLAILRYIWYAIPTDERNWPTMAEREWSAGWLWPTRNGQLADHGRPWTVNWPTMADREQSMYLVYIKKHLFSSTVNVKKHLFSFKLFRPRPWPTVNSRPNSCSAAGMAYSRDIQCNIISNTSKQVGRGGD